MTDRVGVDFLNRWIGEFAVLIGANADLLTRLDSAIGDADHGINMNRGVVAVMTELRAAPPESAAALLEQVGTTLAGTVGGASGPLYGTFFLRMGVAAGGPGGWDGQEFAKALRSGIDGVVHRGSAELGDKTLFDVLEPSVAKLEDVLAAGVPLIEALRCSAKVAVQARDATRDLRARKGRASYLGERSVGHQDPGATSAAMLIVALTRSIV